MTDYNKNKLRADLNDCENMLTQKYGTKITLKASYIEEVKINDDSLNADYVIQTASKVLGIPVENIRGNTRKREVCEARFICYKILRDADSTVTYHQIGTHFNHRDHSSIIHGVNMANDLLEWDRGFRENFDRVNKQISKEQTQITEKTLEEVLA